MGSFTIFYLISSLKELVYERCNQFIAGGYMPITLTETARITVDQTITETLNNSKFNLEGLKVAESQVSFIITAPTPGLIEELITGLKDVTTRNIKNNCTDMVIQSPSVWEEGYLVRTLEYPLESYIPTHTTSQSVNA